MKIEKEVCDICGADAMQFCWRAHKNSMGYAMETPIFPAIKLQLPNGQFVDGQLCEKHWLELNNLVFQKLAEKAGG